MRARALLIAIASTAVACTSTPTTTPTTTPEPSVSDSPSPTPSPGPSEEPAVAMRATHITYASGWPDVFDMAADDLWLYDVDADSNSRLTFDGSSTFERHPRFFNDSIAYFVNRDNGKATIFTVDPAGAPPEPVKLYTHPVHLQTFEPSHDGGAIAFLSIDFDEGEAPLHVWLWTADDGATELRAIPQESIGGREGFQDDEIAIHWSPDGSKLLVTYTPFDHFNRTLWVMDVATGEDVTAPRYGTFGRWLDDDTILYRRFVNATAWRTLDLATGTQTPVALGTGYRPMLSPDGGMIAYDNGSATPKVRVFDLGAATMSTVATTSVGAVWLTDAELLAGGSIKCASVSWCEEFPYGQPWAPSGGASRFPVVPGSASATDAMLTLDADVSYVPA